MVIKNSNTKQSGIASIELVLISPFLLLILIMIKESVLAMRTKQIVVVSARSAAWNQTLTRQCNTAFSIADQLKERINLPFRQGIRVTCHEEDGLTAIDKKDDYWWTSMEAAGVKASKDKLLGIGDDATDITQYFHKMENRVNNPIVITARVRTTYDYRLGLVSGRFDIVGNHAVSANGYWTSEEKILKNSYDQILKEKLGATQALFPNLFFPKPSSKQSSGGYDKPNNYGNKDSEERERMMNEKARQAETEEKAAKACQERNKVRKQGEKLEICPKPPPSMDEWMDEWKEKETYYPG